MLLLSSLKGRLKVMRSLLFVVLVLAVAKGYSQKTNVLKADDFAHYVEFFNSVDDEPIKSPIRNSQCWDWMQNNVPLFQCPDEEIEQIYYYRWWVFRKHIKETPVGYVITEFLPEVGHAKKYNTIACAAGLHVDEGKWLNNKQYIADYLNYWFSDEGQPRHYSCWFATSIYEYCTTIGDFTLAQNLLPKLVDNFRGWEKSNLHESGLFWSYDDRDGGEHSISGSGLRPTLNSFMYADALSISKMATQFGDEKVAKEFKAKAEKLKELMQTIVWDKKDEFFCTLPLEKRDDKIETYNHNEVSVKRHVRELYGYFPWRFNLPDNGFEKAWKQVMDKNGFYAPYGPTTAEQRHPLFMKNRIKRCQWDGSSWPFATSLTLGGMRNLLHHYDQKVVDRSNFLELMKIYAHSQHRTLPYGEVIPWVGESLHPQSGIWLSRAIALDMKIKAVAKRYWKDKNSAVLRGKDYNHSSYCDLVISGLVGLEMNADGSFMVDPLIPAKSWNWFCLDGVQFKGKTISIVYDKDGSKYGKGKGLSVFVDGKLAQKSSKLEALKVEKW
ncbi:hypothetical protein EMN47_06815 [Prolixibacteraceae bacterium JC049]|nr:hypothetical protein [Prolixibacteraceae bacterium JC049]